MVPTRLDYTFTRDWFSEDHPEKVVLIFEKELQRYKGLPCKFLEIGSFEGMSSIWMLENILTHEDSKMYCIDAWAEWTENAFSRFIENINKTGKRDKVDIIKGDSANYLGKFPENYFDFIYVDGDHNEQPVIKDATMSFRILKKGGIMAFDDYLLKTKYPNSPCSKIMIGSTKDAVDYFINAFSDQVEIIHKDYQLWIKKI